MDDFDYSGFYDAYQGVGYTPADTSGFFTPTDPYDYRFINYVTPDSTQSGAEGTGGAPGSRTDLPFIDLSGGGGGLSGLWNALKGSLTSGRGQGLFGSGIGLLPLILGALAAKDRDEGVKPSGGGTQEVYGGPREYTRSVAQSRYGPVVKYAASGGVMRAEDNPVVMEDGGFVMTKRAVDGAGGPQGIERLIPGARMIGGPPDPTGRRDKTPAVIVGRTGVTPAALSNGEAYVPKRQVQKMGGAQGLYALMNDLQKRG